MSPLPHFTILTDRDGNKVEAIPRLTPYSSFHFFRYHNLCKSRRPWYAYADRCQRAYTLDQSIKLRATDNRTPSRNPYVSYKEAPEISATFHLASNLARTRSSRSHVMLLPHQLPPCRSRTASSTSKAIKSTLSRLSPLPLPPHHP